MIERMTCAVDQVSQKKIVISDTDFLSGFLWRGEFGIVVKVFAGMDMDIVVPQAVIDELSYSMRTKTRLADVLLRLNEKKEKKQGQGEIYIQDIELFSEAGLKYEELKKTLGKGEAAALSMLCYSDRRFTCLASNNLKDVGDYVRRYGIELWTTAEVLDQAVSMGILTENRAEKLWDKMYEDGLYLPTKTFGEYQVQRKAV